MPALSDLIYHIEGAELELLKIHLCYEQRYGTGMDDVENDLHWAKGPYETVMRSKISKGAKDYWRARMKDLRAAIRATQVAYASATPAEPGYGSIDSWFLWTGSGLYYVGSEEAPLDYSQIFYYPTWQEAEKSKEFADYIRRRLDINGRKKVEIDAFEVHIIPEPYLSSIRERWATRRLRERLQRH